MKKKIVGPEVANDTFLGGYGGIKLALAAKKTAAIHVPPFSGKKWAKHDLFLFRDTRDALSWYFRRSRRTKWVH